MSVAQANRIRHVRPPLSGRPPPDAVERRTRKARSDRKPQAFKFNARKVVKFTRLGIAELERQARRAGWLESSAYIRDLLNEARHGLGLCPFDFNPPPPKGAVNA
jgi:hypothetical protein